MQTIIGNVILVLVGDPNLLRLGLWHYCCDLYTFTTHVMRCGLTFALCSMKPFLFLLALYSILLQSGSLFEYEKIECVIYFSIVAQFVVTLLLNGSNFLCTSCNNHAYALDTVHYMKIHSPNHFITTMQYHKPKRLLVLIILFALAFKVYNF